MVAARFVDQRAAGGVDFADRLVVAVRITQAQRNVLYFAKATWKLGIELLMVIHEVLDDADQVSVDVLQGLKQQLEQYRIICGKAGNARFAFQRFRKLGKVPERILLNAKVQGVGQRGFGNASYCVHDIGPDAI